MQARDGSLKVAAFLSEYLIMTKGEQPVAPHPVLQEYYEDPSQRRAKVDQMFDSSAAHYDWITNMMSFGSGRWYRRDALLRAGVKEGHKVLDVGAGTGVVSLLSQAIVGANGLVVALDPSKGMLSEAIKSGVELASQGLGESLPFEDNTFDFVTMGYALRHVADLRGAFDEYKRVLKPGGKILLLEITRPEGKIKIALLKFYLKFIIPNISKVFRKSADSKVLMRYYWDTIEQCVPPQTIINALKDSGLAQCNRAIALGIFSEYTGVKP